MDLDLGLIRFFTKVAEKAPRGLRLLLFKEKVTGNEKLVFIVKTASDQIDELGVSRMTWQIEQSKTNSKIAIVRLLILPDDSKEFFQSEAGLILNEEKDRKNLVALAEQKSIELYFFNDESDFHSKVELLTTYNMATSVNKIIDSNPFIDSGRLIIQSENLSEIDIKNVMNGKVKDDKLGKQDLYEAVQKKMPTISTNTIRTKPEEYTKTSIKSSDVVGAGNIGQTSIPIPKKKVDVNERDIKKTLENNAPVTEKVTSNDLLKTVPHEKLKVAPTSKPVEQKATETPKAKAPVLSDKLEKKPNDFDLHSLSADDLMSVLGGAEIEDTKITPEELLKSIPPNKLKADDFKPQKDLSDKLEKKPNNFDLNALSVDDLMSVLSNSSPGKITANDLLNSIPPNTIKAKDISNSTSFTQNELLNSIARNETVPLSSIIGQNKTVLNKDNLKESLKDERVIEEEGGIGSHTAKLSKDDLLSALMSEPTPLKEMESALMTDLMSEPSPLKTTSNESSQLMKEIESNIKVSTSVSISEDDLLKALRGE